MALTDKEYASVGRRMKALVAKWVRPIGLGWWRVTVSVFRQEAEMPNTANKQGVDSQWQLAMSTNVSWAYRDGKISVNGEVANEMSDEHLEAAFLHELGHLFLNEMRSIAKDEGLADNWLEHEEHVATILGQALGWAREAGYTDAKKKRRKN